MKRVGFIATLIFLLPFVIYGYTSPGKPQGFVNDFASILSTQEKSSLELKLSDFKKQTSIEIAVVTIPTLGDETIETYAVKLFEEWGIGDKEKDNGTLFLIAPTERKVRIEVGYGLEGVLTDAQSYGIIQKIIIPEFKSGNMQAGILKGSDAIISVVKSEADYSAVDNNDTKSYSKIFEFAVFIFFILISLLASTKSWWLGGVLGGIAGIIIGIFQGVVVGAIATIVLILLGLLIDYILSKFGGGKGGGFFPIFFGGGGHGGGSSFGGFGGGSSGGGGSSRSW